MFGFSPAKAVIEAGRSALFRDSLDLPHRVDPDLKQDDLTPQFGVAGANYRAGGLLLVGLNPGNGPPDVRTAGDTRMMPALRQFAANPTLDNFASASAAYARECQHWPIWRMHVLRILAAAGVTINEIGYVNALPWRTASEGYFSDSVAKLAAALYLRPLLLEMQPRLIVALGKRLPSLLGMTDCELPEIVVWNRSRALTETVRWERDAAERAIRKAFSRSGIGEPPAPLAGRPQGSAGHAFGTSRQTVNVASPGRIIRLLSRENPKTGKSRLRFDCYRDGMTVDAYREAVRMQLGETEAKKCRADIDWDCARHFIRLEP